MPSYVKLQSLGYIYLLLSMHAIQAARIKNFVRNAEEGGQTQEMQEAQQLLQELKKAFHEDHMETGHATDSAGNYIGESWASCATRKVDFERRSGKLKKLYEEANVDKDISAIEAGWITLKARKVATTISTARKQGCEWVEHHKDEKRNADASALKGMTHEITENLPCRAAAIASFDGKLEPKEEDIMNAVTILFSKDCKLQVPVNIKDKGNDANDAQLLIRQEENEEKENEEKEAQFKAQAKAFRTPYTAGCYQISDRKTCCLHSDGRTDSWGGYNCVPAKEGATFSSGSICEPSKWTDSHGGDDVGTCQAGPSSFLQSSSQLYQTFDASAKMAVDPVTTTVVGTTAVSVAVLSPLGLILALVQSTLMCSVLLPIFVAIMGFIFCLFKTLVGLLIQKLQSYFVKDSGSLWNTDFGSCSSSWFSYMSTRKALTMEGSLFLCLALQLPFLSAAMVSGRLAYAYALTPVVCRLVGKTVNVTEHEERRFEGQSPSAYRWPPFKHCLNDGATAQLHRFFNYGAKEINIDAGLVASDGVRLTGWYLPASAGRRVVIGVHGFKQAAVDYTMMVPGHMMRKSGISFLAVNQRNFCGSDSNRCHCTTLGSEERLDIEAAIRYLVEDPQGLLGVKRSPSDIGIFSVSGGPGSQAFLVNEQLAGMWLDSAVYDWKARFQRSIDEKSPISSIPFLADTGFWCAAQMTGHGIRAWNPKAVLADPARLKVNKRRVFVTYHRSDTVVTPSQGDHWTEQLTEAGFTVSSWSDNATIDKPGVCDEHVTLMLHQSKDYERNLCNFWSSVWPELPRCSTSNGQCTGVIDQQKRDCGFEGANQSSCEGKGCCWQKAPRGLPWCYHKSR